MPPAWKVFFAALIASVLVSMLSTSTLFPDTVPMHDITVLLIVMNLAFYFVVLRIAGYAQRSVQSLTAILGADALLTLAYIGVFVVIDLGAGRSPALTVAWLLSCWSVPVEGHIIARALQQHWIVGIAIALVAYIVLFLTYLQMVDLP